MLVIIPAKNEAKSIQIVIRDIKLHFSGEIVVIDDASDDNTAQLARDLGATVIQLPFSLGAWGAIQTGLRYAVKNAYHIVITMDGDGQHQARFIPNLLSGLDDACVVIGAYPQRGSYLRRLAWAMFRYISNIKLQDLTSGFRVYNRTAITLLASRAATLLEYQDMGVLMLLEQAQLKIIEIPIDMQSRLDGHSRIFSSWLAVSYYMLQTLLLCFGRRNFRKW